MSLHTKPVVPAVVPPPPSARQMEVVVVTRRAIARDGWPQSWTALKAIAEAQVKTALRDQHGAEPEYYRRVMSLGELTQAAYQPLDLAFFREGGEDRSCLVAQAWTA